MRRKIIGVLLMVIGLLALVAVPAMAAYPSPDEPVIQAEPEKLPPVAIGAHRVAGTHLVPPSKSNLMAILHKEGLPLDATPSQIQAAAEEWYADFQKQTDTWVNPKVQEWVQQREAELADPGLSVQQIQPVTASVFAMAVDFGATEKMAPASPRR
jgi:hypothetical protein